MLNKNSLPNSTNVSSSDYLPETLITTKKIIELARAQGVDFGSGNPEERIRYYIKLGLLPHAVRLAETANSKSLIGKEQGSTSPLTINDKRSPFTVGHLPFSAVATLRIINRYKQKGLSYPQISQKFKKAAKRKEYEAKKAQTSPPTVSPIVSDPPTKHFALINKSGLSAEEVEKKLQRHHADLEEKLSAQKEEITSSAALKAEEIERTLQKHDQEIEEKLSAQKEEITSSAALKAEEIASGKLAQIEDKLTAQAPVPTEITRSVLVQGPTLTEPSDTATVTEHDLNSLAKYQGQGRSFTEQHPGEGPTFTKKQADTLEDQAKFFPPYPTKKIVTLATFSSLVAFLLLITINARNIGTHLKQSASNQAEGSKISSQLTENLDKVG